MGDGPRAGRGEGVRFAGGGAQGRNWAAVCRPCLGRAMQRSLAGLLPTSLNRQPRQDEGPPTSKMTR